MTGPLAGVRVIEAATVITGPLAGMLLCDLGADVIKVELPGQGDIFRHWSDTTGPVSPPFAAFNRAKRSVTIDLHTPAGTECFRRLAADADVVLENFRPGVLDRMGVGYEAIRAVQPRIVYCSITGAGPTGPDSHRPTYDAIAQATSGLWSQLTDLDSPEPVGPATCDQLAGVYAALGIVAALQGRDRTGEGRHLSVSMLAAAISFQASPFALQTMEGIENDKWSRARRSQTYAFRAEDDLPFAIHLSTPDKFWRGMLDAVSRLELADDERFRTKARRIDNYHELHAELALTFQAKPREAWLALLRDRDIPVAPINTVAEALQDDQVQHLGIVQKFGEGDDTLDLVGLPIDFGSPDIGARPGPPVIGQHTDEVLRRIGYSVPQIADLRASGVI